METGSQAAAVGHFLAELLHPHHSASIAGVLGSCATMPPPRLRVAQDQTSDLDQLSRLEQWFQLDL